MAKLVLSRGGAILYQCLLDKERLTLGSEARNQIVIADPEVSPEQAAIMPVGNDHILEDLQSVNGTYVNGKRVVRYILQHGDVIELGAYYLRYLNPRASAGIDLERTMLIEGLQRSGENGADAPTAPSAESPLPSARLAKIRFPKGRMRVIAGSRSGLTIVLDRVVATLGQPGEQLAVVTRRPQGYFITHVDGRRYPRVNDRSIGKDARMLRNGDVIEVAGEKLEFFVG